MQSPNRNDVARDIEEGIREGRYKDCLHLSIGDNGGYSIGGFFTRCAMSAFEGFRREGSIVTTGVFHCPDDCHFYESRVEAQIQAAEEERRRHEEERAERRKRKLERLGKFLAMPFQWFASLPWQTQILFVFLAILLFTPKWVPLIIRLIKAVR